MAIQAGNLTLQQWDKATQVACHILAIGNARCLRVMRLDDIYKAMQLFI